MNREIAKPNVQIAEQLREKLETRCVTDGGLGLLGDYLVRLAGIQGQVRPQTNSWAVRVFAADHGVVEEGISNFSWCDSTKMLSGLLCGKTAVGVLAGFHHIPLECWDVGLRCEVGHPEGQIYSLKTAKVAKGTNNLAIGPAMTEGECCSAISVGRTAVSGLAGSASMIALGEMGMGNTTAASAVTAALLTKSPSEVVGMGAGNRQISHKQEIVARALTVNAQALTDPLPILAALGGLEIAALVGACLEAAATGKAIVLDGFVTAAAALTATKLDPRVKDYLFASHLSPEPGHSVILAELGLQPPMSLGLRIGEGAGALLLYPLLNQAAALCSGLAGFNELGIDNEQLGGENCHARKG